MNCNRSRPELIFSLTCGPRGEKIRELDASELQLGRDVNSPPKLAQGSPSAAASALPSAASRTAAVLPLEHGRKAVRVRAADLNSGARTVSRTRTWVRRAHGLVGVISALNLLLLIATGFLLQHRETFRLDERMISRKILPHIYRSEDGPEGVRTDIVVADLHSGRLFGRTGALVLDGITLGWLVLLTSGLVMYAVGRRRKEGGSSGNGNGNGYRRREPAE